MNLTGLSAFLVRARVLASSALTYLTAISAVLVALAQQLENFGGVPEWVTRGLASVIAVVGVAVFQVRRVTPVAAKDQGLLPPKGPAVATVDGAADRGVIANSTLVAVLIVMAIIAVAIWIWSRVDVSVEDDSLASWVLASLVP